MSARATLSKARNFLPSLVLAGAFAAASPAAAVDPVIDPMLPNEGATATAPRPAERETKRDIDNQKAPTLTERFGLPPVSGPLPPLLSPPPEQPVLLDRGREALPPPPPRPSRARQPRNVDG